MCNYTLFWSGSNVTLIKTPIYMQLEMDKNIDNFANMYNAGE